MYCLTNICYVCLKKKNNLISSVNSSVSVNEELRRIIGYHAFNQPWLKSKRIVLICEECYSLLRKTYQFLKMWRKNSALLQGYIDLLNTTTIPNTGNEAELHVHVDIKQTDMNDVKREVKLEDEQIYTFQWEHNIEEIEDALIIKETKDLFTNLEDSFVKEENTWKREDVGDTEECPTDNNFTESINNEPPSETSLNDDSHLSNTDSVSSGFAGKQMHATNKSDSNTATKKPYKCSTCCKSFISKTELNMHTRIHTDNKSYECAICKKRFNRKANLVVHMRVHTGIKSYECAICKKRFNRKTNLVVHMRVHTGIKPYECATCKKCFTTRLNLVVHMRTHTGEKPYECATCKKSFARRAHLLGHLVVHTSEKPYKCSKCTKYFRHRSSVTNHMRNKHPNEEPH